MRGFVIILLSVGGGCEKQQAQFEDETQKAAFPEIMVGTWEAETGNENKWSIKFEADGSIKEIIHAIAGPVDVTAGGVDMEVEQSHFIFVLGPCEARYVPETNTIKVKIIVESFIISTPNGDVELKLEDYFDGAVSKDGKIWEAIWREYCWPKEDKPPKHNGDYVKLFFSKVN